MGSSFFVTAILRLSLGGRPAPALRPPRLVLRFVMRCEPIQKTILKSCPKCRELLAHLYPSAPKHPLRKVATKFKKFINQGFL